jgi:hypothetical protein
VIRIDCEQGSDEWLAARCGIPTASEFATVLSKGRSKNEEAVGRAKYRRRLAIERINRKPVGGGFDSAAIRQGHEREPLALAAYMVRSGLFGEPVGFCRHDEIECGASPDLLVGDDGGVEVKCPEILAHGDYLMRSDCPPAYVALVQGNLWITGRKWWDFVSWNPDYPPALQLHVVRVLPDPDYIAALELAVRLFVSEVVSEEQVFRQRMAA